MKLDGLFTPDSEAQMTRDCIQALQDAVKDPKTPATARSQAARTLLEALGVVGGKERPAATPGRDGRRLKVLPVPVPSDDSSNDPDSLRDMLKQLAVMRSRLEEAGDSLRAGEAAARSPIDI